MQVQWAGMDTGGAPTPPTLRSLTWWRDATHSWNLFPVATCQTDPLFLPFPSTYLLPSALWRDQHKFIFFSVSSPSLFPSPLSSQPKGRIHSNWQLTPPAPWASSLTTPLLPLIPSSYRRDNRCKHSSILSAICTASLQYQKKILVASLSDLTW